MANKQILSNVDILKLARDAVISRLLDSQKSLDFFNETYPACDILLKVTTAQCDEYKAQLEYIQKKLSDLSDFYYNQEQKSSQQQSSKF